MKTRILLPTLMVAVVGMSAACSTDTTSPQIDDATLLLSVQPAGGAANVSVSDPVVVMFDHAMGVGMEAYAALHEGSVTGPVVAGLWTRSQDGTQLMFVPTSPLKPSTTYVIHLGGEMMDANGGIVNLEMHGTGMGGTWASQTMMTGGMGGQNTNHMGSGWQHPSNGSFGMVFTFTTSA